MICAGGAGQYLLTSSCQGAMFVPGPANALSLILQALSASCWSGATQIARVEALSKYLPITAHIFLARLNPATSRHVLTSGWSPKVISSAGRLWHILNKPDQEVVHEHFFKRRISLGL
jgi:hypothetical protein